MEERRKPIGSMTEIMVLVVIAGLKHMWHTSMDIYMHITKKKMVV